MHDVHRDSLIQKQRGKEKTEHSHIHTSQKNHDHTCENQGHDHKHDDCAYEGHGRDLHIHSHDYQNHREDRAWKHMHEHAHAFYHQHYHAHSQDQTSIAHKIFKDPARDWFGVGLMSLLITAGYLKWLPGLLSNGMIVCAAVIGIFPFFKNALFDCISRKRFSPELFLAVLLLAGLFAGKFLETALISLVLLVGSFMRLDFAWRRN